MMPASEEPARVPPYGAVVGLLAAAVILRLWVMRLGSSLWLDEFGTTWITSGPFAQIVPKARLFPQSIPYAALIRLVRNLTGSSEPSLRWPSLVAMLAAAGLVLCLGRRLVGPVAGVAAAALFVTFPQVEFSAADARPYAFGVLAMTAALFFLVRWLDDARTADAIGYVLCASLSIYFQYIFAVSLAAHAAYVWRRRRESAVSTRALWLAAGAVVVLLVPAAALVVEIGARRSAHAVGPPPGVRDLIHALVPVRNLGMLAAALVVASLFRIVRGLPTRALDSRDRDSLALLGTAVLVPPLALFAVSRWVGASLLEGRYLLAAAPAWAVLLGAFVARLRPAAGRFAVLALTLGMTLAARGRWTRRQIVHGVEDWRGAVAALNAANGEHPVFLAGSFVESSDADVVQDPRQEAYLLAPFAYYPTRGRPEILPLRAGPADDAEGDRRIGRALTADRFGLIERSSRFPSWTSTLAERLGPLGYSTRDVWSSPALRVRIFVRSP